MSEGHESGLQLNWGHPFTHKWCRWSLGRKLAWSPHLEQLCVWQTFGLLTTHRQGPSCSTGVCQLGTQMGLWESQSGVYQSLDVTPLSQTSMPPLSLGGHLHRDVISGVVDSSSDGREFKYSMQPFMRHCNVFIPFFHSWVSTLKNGKMAPLLLIQWLGFLCILLFLTFQQRNLRMRISRNSYVILSWGTPLHLKKPSQGRKNLIVIFEFFLKYSCFHYQFVSWFLSFAQFQGKWNCSYWPVDLV